jgi:nicotinate phosphoribosyltransferase
MTQTKIFASGDLNEHKIADLISRGAQIDSFGVGTELATSFDAPALSGVYKLAGLEENGHVSMRIKLSHDKGTYPGPKQVWRLTDESGSYNRDIITLADEAAPSSQTSSLSGSWRPLLDPVMKQGRNVEALAVDRSLKQKQEAQLARLNEARDRAQDQLRRLPNELLALDSQARYPVVFSQLLSSEKEKLEQQIVSQQRVRE